jgi:hypothetical protein
VIGGASRWDGTRLLSAGRSIYAGGLCVCDLFVIVCFMCCFGICIVACDFQECILTSLIFSLTSSVKDLLCDPVKLISSESLINHFNLQNSSTAQFKDALTTALWTHLQPISAEIARLRRDPGIALLSMPHLLMKFVPIICTAIRI